MSPSRFITLLASRDLKRVIVQPGDVGSSKRRDLSQRASDPAPNI